MGRQYPGDFHAGGIFRSGRMRIGGKLIPGFSIEFDPQPFHLVS